MNSNGRQAAPRSARHHRGHAADEQELDVGWLRSRWIYVCLPVVAAMFLFFAAARFYSAATLSIRGVQARGEVVEQIGGRTEQHRVRFTTEDGQVVETDADGPAGRSAEVGDRVRVTYDPQNPETVSEAPGDLVLESAAWLVGVGVLVFWWRRLRRSRADG